MNLYRPLYQIQRHFFIIKTTFKDFLSFHTYLLLGFFFFFLGGGGGGGIQISRHSIVLYLPD